MAISNNILVAALSGSLGKQIVFRRYGNKTVVSSFPDMTNRKLSAKQKAVNEHIKKATARAKEIIADPESRNAALLRLNVTRNRLFTALIKEYFALMRAGS
jgi:hypothetical protein